VVLGQGVEGAVPEPNLAVDPGRLEAVLPQLLAGRVEITGGRGASSHMAPGLDPESFAESAGHLAEGRDRIPTRLLQRLAIKRAARS